MFILTDGDVVFSEGTEECLCKICGTSGFEEVCDNGHDFIDQLYTDLGVSG